MQHSVKYIITCILPVLTFMPFKVDAQIKPPGYERELKLYEEQRNTGSVFDRETVIVYDTAIIYDPDTYEETIKIIPDTMTIRAYLESRLSMQDPDRLLNGTSVKITNPVTYGEMIIRWNSKTRKIDTLFQN